MIHLEEIQIVEDHADIIGPVEEVLVEPARSEYFLQDGRPLTHRNHVQHSVKEPDTFSCRHSMIQLHQDLDCFVEKQVIELRRYQTIVLVYGLEPACHQF
jgi:hypothetical protein